MRYKIEIETRAEEFNSHGGMAFSASVINGPRWTCLVAEPDAAPTRERAFEDLKSRVASHGKAGETFDFIHTPA